jgi:hypothetical protein
MDKIAKYESAILQILKEYAAIPYANLDAENRLLIDREKFNYQLVTIGWEGNRRVHAVTLHFEILNGKIYIQQDQTEYGTADELLEKGIPKSDIVLAYLSKRRREELDFAVA